MQVKAFVERLNGDRVPFSAKDVYDALEHPAKHDFKSSIGAINKALHQHWAEEHLVAFADAEGSLLREADFVAPGSAAIEHPQVFAARGSPSPKEGYEPVSYREHHNRSANPAGAPAGTGPAPETVLPDEHDETEDELEAELARARRTLTDLLFDTKVDRGTAPDWLPDPLLREWVSAPGVVRFFRDGLDRADSNMRRQLILTGIGRKGAVSPDSAPAGALARLCRASSFFWRHASAYALQEEVEVGQGLPLEQLPGLPGNLDALLEEYDPELIVLICLRLGIESDELQVLAAETAEALGKTSTSAHDEELNSLRARLELAETETREAKQELKQERAKRKAIERAGEEGSRELERLRAQTKKAGTNAAHLAELQQELVRARSQVGALSAQLETAREEAETADELEAQLVAAEAELVSLQDAASAANAQIGRLHAADQELQDALRTIGEQAVRIEQLEGVAGELPELRDARSLVQLLDGAIGSLVGDASKRIGEGEAREDDRQLLSFAAQFIEFKSGLATTVAPLAAASQIPAVEDSVVAAGQEALPLEHQAEPAEEEPADGEERRAALARRRRTKLGWIVKPIGGAGEIGGSAILATTPGGRSILLDAGQRVRGIYGDASNDNDFHFGLSGVDELAAILVSHAHIDHTGSLPVLHRNLSARQAPPIPVYASQPTIDLAEIMMADSAKIQHARDRKLSELGESDFGADMFRGRAAYDRQEVTQVVAAMQPATPYVTFEIPGSGILCRFEPVAHVLGSCAIHLTDTESGTTLLYTGDLGPLVDPQVTLPDFGGIEQISAADLVIMESTYGKPLDPAPDGRKAAVSRRQRERANFYKIAGQALHQGGCVLLPCFSLGRAQELARLVQQAEDRDLAGTRIYIGGMAERILEVYVDYAERGERDHGSIRWVGSGQFPRTSSLHTRLSPDYGYADVAHELLASGESCFIIASPAMLSGGWSLTFANEMVDDPRHAIIFSGFLPRDDRTQLRLSDWRRGSTYTLDGNKRPIQCEWERVGLSAHAPAVDLRSFGKAIAAKSLLR